MKFRSTQPRSQAERWGYADVYVDEELARQPFQEGFGFKTIVAAFFLGFVMLPGSIYMGLVGGQSIGPAATWTTIILFAEVARRSLKTLRRQEIFVIFWIAGSLISVLGHVMLFGLPFANLIWAQFLVQSPTVEGFGLTDAFPRWFVPEAASEAILTRSLWHRDFSGPIVFVLFAYIVGRASMFGLGYALYVVTARIERLPFPLAPIAAQGVTALAETEAERESWRWRVFSMGAVIGLAFGAIYIGVPSITGILMPRPLTLLPIPWLDATSRTESILPATAIGLSTNLGLVFAGFVLPFWAVVGTFAAAVATLAINPILFHQGVMKNWRPGMDVVQTIFANQLDFWLSISIGTAAAVFLLGLYEIAQRVRRHRRENLIREVRSPAPATPPERIRGPLVLGIGLFLVSSIASLVFCRLFIPGFPLWILGVYTFAVVPLLAYVEARMYGLAGQPVAVPYLREAMFIWGANISGYSGLGIWFAPLATTQYGMVVQHFKEVELTRTRFSSIIKGEFVVMPILLVTSFLFWALIWRMGNIPSPIYPYAQRMWELQALTQSLWWSSTVEGTAPYLMQAIKGPVILAGLAVGVGAYAVLNILGLPIIMIYGLIRGLGGIPHLIFPEMIGALLGRYYFRKRFGAGNWHRWTPVLGAGFACGMGLVGMACVAVALVANSVSPLLY